MKAVWKYPIDIKTIGQDNRFSILMPMVSTVISFGEQLDGMVLWAVVDTTSPLKRREFVLAGTGHTLPETTNLRFIGTTSVSKAALVFHLFEVTDYAMPMQRNVPQLYK